MIPSRQKKRNRQLQEDSVPQFDASIAAKNGQIAECLYHLNRMNASPWWRLGKWLERMVSSLLRLFSKGGQSSAAALPPLTGDYQRWIALYDTLSERDRDEITRHALSLEWKPLISLVVAAENASDAALRRTIDSLRNQLYPDWELTIAFDEPRACVAKEMSSLDPRIQCIARSPDRSVCETVNSALAVAKGSFIAFVDPGDTLALQALYEIAVEINDSSRCGHSLYGRGSPEQHWPKARALFQDGLESGTLPRPQYAWPPVCLSAFTHRQNRTSLARRRREPRLCSGAAGCRRHRRAENSSYPGNSLSRE